ncbi:YdcF family protein [Pontibacillus sp. HMF3514]|uniref:YdcF family protein n=1 Tax=Pontibacillus sp. HMF3514 TaxID=2692425 RepID=UPI0013200052|nr:YdcF family protein [Pontibacillus sp. HMF3514]QHE53516.1 YdcF family protein [Pontibacillus sp. HMF3514]
MKKLLQLLLLLVLVYVGYAGYSIWTFTGNDYNKKTDAAIVLGAAAYYDKPSPVFQERINHALKLYKNNKVDHLIFTGGKGDGAQYAESEVAKMYAIRNGVPKKDISIETASKITEQNLDEAKKLGEKKGFETYRLVSDPLHLKRAMAMARDRNMDVHASPTQTSAYKSLETRVPFFLREWMFYLGYEASVIADEFLRIANLEDSVEL